MPDFIESQKSATPKATDIFSSQSRQHNKVSESTTYILNKISEVEKKLFKHATLSPSEGVDDLLSAFKDIGITAMNVEQYVKKNSPLAVQEYWELQMKCHQAQKKLQEWHGPDESIKRGP